MSSSSKHHSSRSPRRDRRWPPYRSSRVPDRYSRDGVSFSSDDMGSRQKGHEPPKNRYSSHSSDGATHRHKLSANSMPHDRTRDSSSSCSSDRIQRGMCTGSGSSNYACTELSLHSKGKLSHGRTDPPGCSMAGVHKALGKRPQEKKHLEVSPKRAKVEQHSVSAALSANRCAIPQAVETPHALRREGKTCSQVDHSGATVSHSDVTLSRELNEKSGQGDTEKTPSCKYTSLLSERFYQWKNIGEKKVLCATAALKELHCTFTEKLLAHRNIPAHCSFLGQSNAACEHSDITSVSVVDSTGSNHGDEKLERQRSLGVTKKELHVTVGLQDADSDGACQEKLKDVFLASCPEPLTLTEEEVAGDMAGVESQGPSLTGGASHDGEVVADKSQDTSFSVKPTIHDGLSFNLPSKICKGQADTPASCRRQYAFGRSGTADVCSDYRQYRVEISPQVNFKSSRPTALRVADGREYHFEGFSVASCVPLDQVPVCYFQRYGCDYSLCLRAEPLLQSFTVRDALLLEEYLFVSLLELYDWAQSLKKFNTELLFFPRFVSSLEGNTCEVLPLCDVLDCLVQVYQPLIQPHDWACDRTTDIARETYGLLVTHPRKSPACIRVDRLESGKDTQRIVHFSSPSSRRKPANDAEQAMYQELYEKTRSRGKLERKKHFQMKEMKMNLARKQSNDHRELLLELPAEGFYSTGIYIDVVQHTLVLPILAHQVLFHDSLHFLEEKLQYYFKNRQLLLCALTHSSFINFSGTTETHVRTTASNCGLRRPEPTISSNTSQQKGLASLVSTVERLEAGDVPDGENRIRNNEQLEFLGDAVLEFLCSLHLYHLFPAYTDGKLTEYRQALVKNKTLTTLATKLGLAGHMLVGGEEGRVTPPLLHTHAATDCFEAVLGALCMDGGLPEVQKMFARLVFPEEDLYNVWMNYSPDPLKQQCPDGDRNMIEQSEPLQRLVTLEQSVGVQFTHIRLLARAFTHASLGYTNLTMGSYQRMEFLGDAVLQFLASLHVYSHFPNHREGHLSVLRTALVHNKQLAELSRQLGFDSYIITNKTEEVQLSDKVLADLVESFLAALLLDKGLQFAQKFLEVCLFPKLAHIIKSSQLVDANTRLHQAVAHRCREEGSKFEMPVYRVLKVEGPSGKQQFTIGVYFRGKRLGVGTGPNTREARAKASEVALQSGLHTRMSSSEHWN